MSGNFAKWMGFRAKEHMLISRFDCMWGARQAVRLEPRFTVTNLTGLPLQMAQLGRDAAMAENRQHRRLHSLTHHGSSSPSNRQQGPSAGESSQSPATVCP